MNKLINKLMNKPATPPADPANPPAETMRLAKALALQADCSRQQAQTWIESGFVTVDGVLVEEPGLRVTSAQQIVLAVNANAKLVQPVTILLHKPVGVKGADAAELIVLSNMATDDRSGIRYLKRHLNGLKATDALALDSSGLMVFTQDWPIQRKLIDDAAKVEQEYIVEVEGQIVPYGLALLKHGLTFNGKPLPPINVSWQNETRLRFALKGVQPGQIAHMCAQVGLEVRACRRIRIGRMSMAGLAVGQWRYLLGYERF
jgi:23S rRNA pseudouridine2604 synthase